MSAGICQTILRMKGRYIVLFWMLPFFYFIGIADILNEVLADSPWYWQDIGYIYFFQITFSIAIISLGFYSKLDWKALLGKKPNIPDFVPALKLTIFIYIFSIAAVYALFIPLSYVTPDFVQWWFIDLPPLIYFDGDSYPFLPNLLNFLSLVVLAPIIEEIAFRGMLLHRWAYKWGIVKAVLISSLIFGAIHPDPGGAMAFGIAMCIIYLKTQSLFIPIICHGLTNLIVWFETLGYMSIEGPESFYSYTLEELQSEWHIGIIFGILSAAWIVSYLNGPHSKLSWRLPKI